MDFSTFKTNIIKKGIASLAILYLCLPLSGSFSEISHKVSHALSQTTAHHEHTNSTAEDHTHTSVSFFDALFSSEKNSTETSQKTVPFNFDKHFTEGDYTQNFIERTTVLDNFGWISSNYKTSLKNAFPPPKSYFS